ncbi:MAG TPA: segregation/condensation protein A [Oligoflexia bacterium]|nr:segregation/condensation protein A [Oligoflexia bacterium]HMP47838.1 segregation/condensation protein A [Oligoflexia bacterium]
MQSEVLQLQVVEGGKSPDSLPSVKNKFEEKSTDNSASVSPAYDIYQVDIGFFSGPMDLLLHLVSLKEVSIEDVSMSEVLEQYLSVVNSQALNLDLEKASEYLVIAATLMMLKSKSLLPGDSCQEDSDESEDEECFRFFEDLRARLKAFELTRERARALIETPQLGIDTFARIDKNAIQIPPEMIAEGESINKLSSLFYSLVKRIGGLGRSIRITIEPVSVVSAMIKLVDSLRILSRKDPLISNDKLKTATFSNIMKLAYKREEVGKSLGSRNVVLGSFIALLELAKRGMVSIRQESGSDDIILNLRMKDVEDGSEMDSVIFTSEFDDTDNPQSDNSEDEINLDKLKSPVLDLDKFRNEKFGNEHFQSELDHSLLNNEGNIQEIRKEEAGNG